MYGAAGIVPLYHIVPLVKEVCVAQRPFGEVEGMAVPGRGKQRCDVTNKEQDALRWTTLGATALYDTAGCGSSWLTCSRPRGRGFAHHVVRLQRVALAVALCQGLSSHDVAASVRDERVGLGAAGRQQWSADGDTGLAE